MINSSIVKYSFNKAAETYDNNCYIQQLIGDKLIHILKVLKPTATNIIDLGCGTGLLTKKIASTYPNFKQFYAIDIAERSLTIAKKRLYKYNIKTLEQNFENLNGTQIADLIFANMSLHWSNNLDHTLSNIYKHLHTKGILAFSIPIHGTFHELDKRTVLPFYETYILRSKLIQCGFTILNDSEYINLLTFPSFILALKSIKNAGANYYGQPSTFTNLLKLRKFTNRPFSLTYKIAIFIAIKK